MVIDRVPLVDCSLCGFCEKSESVLSKKGKIMKRYKCSKFNFLFNRLKTHCKHLVPRETMCKFKHTYPHLKFNLCDNNDNQHIYSNCDIESCPIVLSIRGEN